jgi:hypothetical protein
VPFKTVPPETALALLAPYLGQEVAVETIQKDDGAPHHVPAGLSRDMVKDLRAKVNGEGIVLQVHLDGAVMSYLPAKDQRKTAILETEVLNVFIVKCADGAWRLSHAPDVQPQNPVEKLADGFRKGSGKDIAVKKPLAVRQRPPGGAAPGR